MTATRHRVRLRGLRLATKVTLAEQIHDVVGVLHLDALQPLHRRAALRGVTEIQGRRILHQEVVDELVVHLQIRARHLEDVLFAHSSHGVEDVDEGEQHHAGVVGLADHGVRLSRTGGAVGEDGAVVSAEDALDETLRRGVVHVTVGGDLAEGAVESVAPLLTPMLLLVQVILLVVGVQDDDHAVVHDADDVLADAAEVLLGKQGATANRDHQTRGLRTDGLAVNLAAGRRAGVAAHRVDGVVIPEMRLGASRAEREVVVVRAGLGAGKKTHRIESSAQRSGARRAARVAAPRPSEVERRRSGQRRNENSPKPPVRWGQGITGC